MPTKPNRQPVRRLTDVEEAKLQAQIAADPDNPEMTDAQLAEMKPASAFFSPDALKALAKRGRPPSPDKRVQLTLKVKPKVIAAFKAGGPGWQTRMNDALEAAALRSIVGDGMGKRRVGG